MTLPDAYLDSATTDPNELVIKHALLVKRIAYHLVARVPPTVGVEDLIQAGMIGLLEAGRNYADGKGANFETYAGIRIRGAMLDEVRRSDWTPRSVHRKIREVAQAVRSVERRTGADAKDVEVAAEMAITLDAYHKILQDATACRLFSIDSPPSEDGGQPTLAGELAPSPEQAVEEHDLKGRLAQAIDNLPERERLVMSLYYDDELNLREIGEVLGVSESRVCQIHSQALVRLRARMAAMDDPPGLTTARKNRRSHGRRGQAALEKTGDADSSGEEGGSGG